MCVEEFIFLSQHFENGVDESVAVCMPSRQGSLKQYTEAPPVLDRFKKWFLHGIAGELLFIEIVSSLSEVYYLRAEKELYQPGRQLGLGWF